VKQANKITVDLDDLGKLVYDGANIVMQPEAEQALLELLELQERVAGAVTAAKRAIEEKALAYNPNFTSVQASRIKVGYQFFGGRYSIDESKLSKLPKDLYKTKTTYSPDSKAIDKYAKDNGKLPLGIVERERTKSIVIKPIKDFAEVDDADV
jgi:hypothetical protein